VPAGTVLEIVGGPGSGKTKCVIEAAAHFLANSVDEGDGVAAMEPIVIVLDTECGVTPGALFLIFSGTGKRLGPPTFLSRRR